MATFINHVAIATPRNGTTTHTVDPSTGTAVAGTLFTPTAGNLLVCVVEGPVTSTTPTGWTLPTNGAAVNNSGLYIWHRTAAGGDSFTTTHNASNYAVIFHFLEFASGSTFNGVVNATGAAPTGGTGPTLSGLTGTNWNAGVYARTDLTINTAADSWTLDWATGTELVEYAEADGATDGYQYSLAYLEDDTASSATFSVTSTNPGGGGTGERFVFSIAAVAGSEDPGEGAVTGAISWSGAATGARDSDGAASGGVSWSGSATGTSPGIGVQEGAATGALSWTGTATGARASSGSASGTVEWSGTASGPSLSLTIADENALTGDDPSNWYDGVGTVAMPAFARSTYYLPGETAEFSVDYGTSFTFSVYRLGHYQDNGGRLVAGPTAGTADSQPSGVTITGGNGALDCSAWSRNVAWDIPEDATPGWYYIFLDGASSDFGHILFCVSDQLEKKPVLAVTGDATWHAAYNGYGGNNLYGATTGVGDISGRAYCSSYDKPVVSHQYVPQTHFFNASWASFKYLESLGIEVGYTTVEQINNDPTILDGREVIIFSGHNEYVPQRMMDKVKELLDEGQKIVNWAANDFFWRVSFGDTSGFPTGNTTNSTGRVMWCRKDTIVGPSGSGHAAGTAFSTEADWTGTWQDTRWSLNEPTTEFMGDRFVANGIRNDELTVPFSMKDSPIWRDCTDIEALTTGQEFGFGAGSLGMEWDVPEGSLSQVSLSSTTVDLENNTADINGETYNNDGVWEHAITIVASSAGLIFNFNSDQWGKTLDNMNIRHGTIASTEARQACLNILADFGVTADSTMVSAAGLVMPTPVSDIEVSYGLPIPPSEGSASGTVSWSGTATGARDSGGSASGAVAWAGTTTGTRESRGATSGALSWTGSATGVTPAPSVPDGAALGTVVRTGVATGARVSRGSVTGAVTWVGRVTQNLYLFSPPTHEEPIYTKVRPLNYYRLTYANSLVKINDTFVSVRGPSAELLDGLVDGVDYFRGGFEYVINGDTAQALIAAGYTPTLI